MVHGVCCLAGAASLIDDIRADLRAEGIPTAIRRHDTATLFDWLISALSYQGISDQVATDYMERHGPATWADIDAKIRWFHLPKTQKLLATSTPVRCPPTSCATGGLTRWPTRYSCSFATLPMAIWSAGSTGSSSADDPASPDRLARLREALVGPLREVYGVSDKVLTMTLSCILLGAPKRQRLWHEVGAGMIAIDTLVHNFPGSHRHPGRIRGRSFIWFRLLPGWRLRRYY